MQTYEEVEGSHKREWSRGVAGGGERGEGRCVWVARSR